MTSQFKFGDRAVQTSTTSGNGDLDLIAPATGVKSLVAEVGDTNYTGVLIEDPNGDWELTIVKVVAGSPDKIQRAATPIKSSTGTTKIVFGSGTKTIACVPISELLMHPGVADAMAETSIASASTCDLGAGGSVFTFRALITGTTTIAGLGAQPNTIRWVRFAGALTLTHNATSLILLGAVNRTTVAGAVGLYVSDGSGNWRELFYNDQDVSTGAVVKHGSLALGGATIGSNKLAVAGAVYSTASVTADTGFYNANTAGLTCTGFGVTTNYTIQGGASSSYWAFVSGGSGGVILYAGASSWAALSMRELKRDLTPIEDPLAILGNVMSGVCLGNYIDDPQDQRQRPFVMYEETELFWPAAANFKSGHTATQEDPETGEVETRVFPDIATVALEQYVPLLLACCDALKAKVAALEAQVAALEA